MSFVVEKLDNPEQSSKIVEEVMRALPDWFYWESTIKDYKEKVKNLPFFAAIDENKSPLGMLALIPHFGECVEILVIGVMPHNHGQGIGKALIKKAEEYAKTNQKKYLTVKTLAPSSPDKFYAQTRKFYESCDFCNLMDITELWDDKNPCLLMIKKI